MTLVLLGSTLLTTSCGREVAKADSEEEVLRPTEYPEIRLTPEAPLAKEGEKDQKDNVGLPKVTTALEAVQKAWNNLLGLPDDTSQDTKPVKKKRGSILNVFAKKLKAIKRVRRKKRGVSFADKLEDENQNLVQAFLKGAAVLEKMQNNEDFKLVAEETASKFEQIIKDEKEKDFSDLAEHMKNAFRKLLEGKYSEVVSEFGKALKFIQGLQKTPEEGKKK